MNINRGVLAAVLVTGGLLAGCGGPAALEAADSAALHARVEAVRAAAAGHDPAGAAQALAAFRTDVRRLLAAGDIDPADADALLAAAGAVAADLPAPTPTPTPSPTPTPKATARPKPAVAPKPQVRHVAPEPDRVRRVVVAHPAKRWKHRGWERHEH